MTIFFRFILVYLMFVCNLNSFLCLSSQVMMMVSKYWLIHTIYDASAGKLIPDQCRRAFIKADFVCFSQVKDFTNGWKVGDYLQCKHDENTDAFIYIIVVVWLTQIRSARVSWMRPDVCFHAQVSSWNWEMSSLFILSHSRRVQARFITFTLLEVSWICI